MISIFGASVTLQKKGYAEQLKSIFKERVEIYGFGGMHLNDAGICFIDKALEKNPTYCFVDWFSTGYQDINNKTLECIDTIIQKCTEKNCKLIFLFFPSVDYLEREPYHEFCKSHLEQRGVNYIDVCTIIDTETKILRDHIHTTKFGSTKYRDTIYSEFEKIKDNIVIPGNINRTKYFDIKKLTVEKTFSKVIELEGNCEIIGFFLTIGPHSGLIEIIDSRKSKIINTWDPYCHYQRNHFSLSCYVDGDIKVNILQDSFDTSNCRRPYDFRGVRKELVIHDVYYTGEYLKIKNISSGIKNKNEALPIKILKRKTRNALSRLKRLRLKLNV